MRCKAQLAGIGFLLLGACSVAQTEDADSNEIGVHEDGFAVLEVDNKSSVLSTIAATGGKLSVCVGLMGFGSQSASAGATLKTQIAETANKWNSLFAGNSEWTVATVDVTFNVQNGECTKTQNDLRVNVWADRTRFQNEFCARRPNWICSANTDTNNRTITVGPVNRGVDVDVFDASRMVHEYGHAMGLADTYKVPGSHDWNGSVQPPSVMNGKSSKLTSDDQLGLWITWRAVKTGARTCNGFGKSVSFTSNVWNSILCDPGALPVITHGARIARDSMLFERPAISGDWLKAPKGLGMGDAVFERASR